MKEIFINRETQAAFEQKGYAVISFLNDQEIATLKAFYYQLEHQFQTGFHASMYNQNEAYRRAIDEKITAIVQSRLVQYLNGYEVLYSNFMVKESGEGSQMKIHQDWSYVEEKEQVSLAIWFPLLDVNHQNGALYMLEGSHRIMNEIRGFGTFDPFEGLESLVKKQATLIPLKAGEAIIWHHRVAHYSPPNQSNQSRIAATSILVPQGAPVYHFYRASNDPIERVEKFRADNDFYMQYELGGTPPASRSLGFIHDEPKPLNEKELLEKLQVQKDFQKNAGWLQKIKTLFNK